MVILCMPDTDSTPEDTNSSVLSRVRVLEYTDVLSMAPMDTTTSTSAPVLPIGVLVSMHISVLYVCTYACVSTRMCICTTQYSTCVAVSYDVHAHRCMVVCSGVHHIRVLILSHV